jgi:glutamyl-tRNA reductase
VAEPDTKDEQPVLNLMLVGADHRSSTMILRDRLFMEAGALPAFYAQLARAGLRQAMVLSTIDRTEIYAITEDAAAAGEEIRKLLTANAGVTRSDIENQSYMLSGPEAVKHAFAVAAALECLVIGDTNFLAQVEDAVAAAVRENAAGPVLTPLMAAAIRTSEQVYKETGIGKRPVSISAAAVDVARDILGDLGALRGLLIGAGEMGELLGSSFLAAGLGHLDVTHSLETRAEAMAQQLNCHAVSFAGLSERLTEADIVITSVNSRRFTLDGDIVGGALRARRRRPQFLIDTGVPGDIDRSVEAIEDAFLYTLDDLERVTREGRSSREADAQSARDLVADAAASYMAVPVSDEDAQGDEADNLETMRRKVLEEAEGDAEKATSLLIDRFFRGKRNR